MDYERTFELMSLAYPTLFPTEVFVLHHLFVTVGNGFTWAGGELMTSEYELPRTVDGARALYAKHRDAANEEARARAREAPDIYERHLQVLLYPDTPEAAREKEIEFRRRTLLPNHPCFFLEDGTLSRTLFGFCEESPFFRIPDDCTASWLGAARRAVRLFSTCCRPTAEDEVLLDAARTLVESEAWRVPEGR